jgi:hypothetical protein
MTITTEPTKNGAGHHVSDVDTEPSPLVPPPVPGGWVHTTPPAPRVSAERRREIRNVARALRGTDRWDAVVRHLRDLVADVDAGEASPELAVEWLAGAVLGVADEIAKGLDEQMAGGPRA